LHVAPPTVGMSLTVEYAQLDIHLAGVVCRTSSVELWLSRLAQVVSKSPCRWHVFRRASELSPLELASKYIPLPAGNLSVLVNSW
jgi:hypothetical protein